VKTWLKRPHLGRARGHRKPNFEDYSCEMVFGEAPPALAEDEVQQQGCLADCVSKRPGARCHSLG
jgi:hypothetical protein